MRVRLVVQHELAALHARRSRASRGSRDSNVDGSGDRRSHGDQKRPAFDVGAHRSEFDCAPQRRYRAKPSERSAAAELSSIFIVRTRPQPFGVQPRCCAQRSAHGNSQSGVARSASRTDASSPLSARYCITTADSHEVLGRSNVARLLDSSSRDARITSTRVHVATGISMELLDGGDLEGSSRKRSHWRQLTSTRRRDSAVRTTARVCDSRGGESLRFARRRESASARLGAPASRGFLRRILVWERARPQDRTEQYFLYCAASGPRTKAALRPKAGAKRIRSRHTWIRYRCSLPGLAGFTSLRWRDHKPGGQTTTRNISHYTENRRRGRDSNPRSPFGLTRFPVVHLRPLGHLSSHIHRTAAPVHYSHSA